MNILVVSQYYWPETFIISDLVKALQLQGHQIEVITGKPNYPEGTIFQGYVSSGKFTEIIEGIPIHRVPIIPRGKNIRGILLNYFSYILSGIFYFPGFIKNKKFDVIFAFVPSPITSVIPVIFLNRKCKSHLAVWVQDLWPESVMATGFIKNRYFLKPIEKLVKWIYKKSDTLLVQSEAFRHSISKFVSEKKIIYYPNPFQETPLKTDEEGKVPKQLISKLQKNKCFVFAGNLGNAQSLDTIVQAAEQLAHLPDCKIIFVGSGSKSDWLKKEIQEKKLTNILLPGRFPIDCMPIIFERSCGLIVTLKNEEIFSYTIPSKVQAYLAAAKPILAALNGEGARIIKVAKAGLVCDAEDASRLAKNIEQIYHMSPAEREELGRAGRSYYLEHFEMQKQSQRLIKIFENRIKGVT